MSDEHRHVHFNTRTDGRGSWYEIHLAAAHAKTSFEKQAAAWLLKLNSEKFFCNVCAGHLKEFLTLNPIDKYIDMEDGLFYLTWKAHDNVNAMLGKSRPSFEEVKAMYLGDDAVCMAGCADESKQSAVQYSMAPSLPATIGISVLPSGQINGFTITS